jgi:hypothetical protein
LTSLRNGPVATGRTLPEDVVYHRSWLDPEGTRCYQVMEAPSPERLNAWVSRWSDVVDFDVIPVVTSAEFCAKRRAQ